MEDFAVLSLIGNRPPRGDIHSHLDETPYIPIDKKRKRNHRSLRHRRRYIKCAVRRLAEDAAWQSKGPKMQTPSPHSLKSNAQTAVSYINVTDIAPSLAASLALLRVRGQGAVLAIHILEFELSLLCYRLCRYNLGQSLKPRSL